MWPSFSVMLQFMNSVVLCRPRFAQQVEGIEDHTTAMTRVLCVERPCLPGSGVQGGMIALSHGNQMDDELACRYVGNPMVLAILPPVATAPVLGPCV